MAEQDLGIGNVHLYARADGQGGTIAEKEEKLEQLWEEADAAGDAEEKKNIEAEATKLQKEINTLKKQNVTRANRTDADVTTKINDIKSKYCSNLPAFNGDPYSDGNPELQALGKALDDGILNDLAMQGFSRDQILDVISGAFPSVGIARNADGSYSLPLGHGEMAAKIYDQFKNDFVLATTGGGPEVQEARAKVEALNKQISQNNEQLKALDTQIKYITTEIEDILEEAIKESKEIQEDQKKAANEKLQKNLKEYTDSKGEMTFEEFQKNLSNDLDEVAGSADSALSEVMRNMIKAETKMSVLDSYLRNMKSLNDLNGILNGELTVAESELANLEEIAATSEQDDPSCNRCDPIGFTAKDGSSVNFFVDKDDNGGLTNENEFLGAENGFNEMKAMDADDDGVLTAKEMADSNLKVVITKDGKQEIMSAAEYFKDTDSVSLKSYNSVNREMANGNKLLGTFNVNVDGEELDTGYQTLDRLDWLDENFEFTDEDEGKGRHAQEINGGEPVEAGAYTDIYNAHMEKYKELRETIDETWEDLGYDAKEMKEEIAETARKGVASGGTIADEAEKTDNANEPQEANAAEAQPDDELQYKPRPGEELA